MTAFSHTNSACPDCCIWKQPCMYLVRTCRGVRPAASAARPACCNLEQLRNVATRAQVCDQPHPLLVAEVVRHCQAAALDEAWKGLEVC